jgi:phage terminase large subunit-like protein
VTPLKALLRALAAAPAQARHRVLAGLSPADVRAIEEEWSWQALSGQEEPPGEWRLWLILAGRGYGKTRAGAEWVWARARECPGARIALVGASIDEVEKVMVEGESGLRACARTGETARWHKGSGELGFPSGAVGQAYSGANPEKLRGAQHHFAWCDELAKWRHPETALDNLQLGMRLGERPRLVVTTTPSALPLLRTIRDRLDTEVTAGKTVGNPHLPPAYVSAMRALYAGTRLGRQELDGELFGEADGALWTRETIEKARAPALTPEGAELRRVMVGVDPPASADGDACGIVVCGLDWADTAYVLADATVAGKRPEGWARAVVAAAETWNADRVVAEANNGGDMVESVLRSVAPGLPVRLVRASRGKIARAEPVATGFETGQIRLAGHFRELEDELAEMTHAGFAGRGSPDRADAMVWALTELSVRKRPEPRVRSL